MKTTIEETKHGLKVVTDIYTNEWGIDTYELHVITIYHSIGGTSKLYRMYVNGNTLWVKKRLDSATKKTFMK